MKNDKSTEEAWQNFKEAKQGTEGLAPQGGQAAKRSNKPLSEEQAFSVVRANSEIIKEGVGEKVGGGGQLGEVLINIKISALNSKETIVFEKKAYRFWWKAGSWGAADGDEIRGVQLAVRDMKIKEVRTVKVPPELGFGGKAVQLEADPAGVNRVLPAWSSLFVEIELLGSQQAKKLM